MDWDRVTGNWKQVKGKVKEKWEEDTCGRIENKTEHFYDLENRLAVGVRDTSVGAATDRFSFDRDGRMFEHQDPEGYTTTYLYDDLQFKKTKIDPFVFHD